jgi:putative flippase GtrA
MLTETMALGVVVPSALERFLNRRPVILQLLRFVAIGAINTTLDFIIFNTVSKFLGIESGFQLGLINIVGFIAAMVQSYFWNRYWTFGNANAGGVSISPIKELLRLILVGGLGAAGFVVVLLGARYQVAAVFYLVVLAVFVGVQLMLWLIFNLKQKADDHAAHFMVFAIVSIIGLLINVGIVSLASHYLVGTRWGVNADLLKNEAKILATVVSLIWNFIGYKLLVFRR